MKPNFPVVAYENAHPEDIYLLLSSNLKEGKPWMRGVKRRCKSGNFYWVDGYMSPVSNVGDAASYQSVRVKSGCTYV